MGEFEFIEALRASFESIGDEKITGIGDDCAVIPLPGEVLGTGTAGGSGGESLVVTTDMLVEGVHFLRHAASAREIGAKSLAVNLSDIAAMGARPMASFLSLALPAECRGGWAEEFMDGYRELSARHGVRLAGGDTTSSVSGVAVNVAVIGRAPNAHLKYRRGALPGDIVVVNGLLGESAAGLRDILGGHLDTLYAATHRNPIPQAEEGAWLGAREEVHSMTDLSDGMASDLVHILKASGVGANVELTAIPTPAPVPVQLSAPAPFPLELAVAGGEDYKLLFTVDPKSFARLAEDYLSRFGTGLYAVGRITESAPEIVWTEGGAPVERDWHGFVHF